MAENVGSYSDANIHNITQAQEAQPTEREMVVLFFSSAILSMTADKLYLGEVRGNNCQCRAKPGGCGKRTVLQETECGENLQREIWKGESRAVLTVTRCVSVRLQLGG